MSSTQSTNVYTTHASTRSRRKRRRGNVDRPLFVLYSLGAALSFASISIFTAIIPIWNANFFYAKGILRGDWTDALPIIPLSLIFVNSLHYLVLRTLKRRQMRTSNTENHRVKGTTIAILHTLRFRLYLLLIAELLLLTLLILAAVTGLYRFWRPAVITTTAELSSGKVGNSLLSTLSLRRSIADANPTSLLPPTSNPASTDLSQHQNISLKSCSLSNVFTRRCNPILYLVGDLQIAALASGTLVWLLNLIILCLTVREHQYQKRKLHTSLRAKAKARLEFLEDGLSSAEKGFGSMTKSKSRHHRPRHSYETHRKLGSDSSSGMSSQEKLSESGPSPMTLPGRAYTPHTSRSHHFGTQIQPTIRPKQYYHNPDISPSRARRAEETQNTSTMMFNPTSQTSYGQAIREARNTLRPTETMRDWLATRHG